MLIISTKPNDTSVLNIVTCLINESPPKIQEAETLIEMLSADKRSWDNRLRISNILLNNGQVDQAKNIIHDLDITEYFQDSTHVWQVNLLLNVLDRTDQGDEITKLLETKEAIEMLSADKNSWDNLLGISNILLNYGQVDQAKNIIHNIDTTMYFQDSINEWQVNLLFEVLLRTGRGDEIAKLLENTKIVEMLEMLEEETLVDLKLDIGRKLIMQGQQTTAKNILAGIDEEKLSNKKHIGDLGLLYKHLSMFDKANRVFYVAERKGCIDQRISTHMAIVFMCLGETDKASIYIDKHAQSDSRIPVNLLWKAKLLNYSGQHVKALYWIDILLLYYPNRPVPRCFGFVEKGNTLRSLGIYEEANNYYQKAQLIEHSLTFWLWIAYFEHAMTLIYLGEIEDALTIVWNGCKCKSHLNSEKFNPCVILYHFLLHRKNRSKEFFISPEKWADNIRFCPFPFLPHKTWMLLLTAIVLKEQGRAEKAKNIIYEIITNSEINNNYQQEYLLTKINSWYNSEYLNYLSSVLFPNDFNWKVIRHIICYVEDSISRQRICLLT